MDNGFSILMLIFGIAILLYAAILSSGNYKLLPLRVQPSLRSYDKKGQTKHIAAITAIVALPISFGGLAGLFFGNIICLIVMFLSAAIIIVIAVIRHRIKSNSNKTETSEMKDKKD